MALGDNDDDVEFREGSAAIQAGPTNDPPPRQTAGRSMPYRNTYEFPVPILHAAGSANGDNDVLKDVIPTTKLMVHMP